MNQNIKRVLITQNQLFNLSGSEIVTLELAEFFSNEGCAVTVLTNVYGKPIKSHFEELDNVTVYGLHQKAAQDLDAQSFDLIWIHHSLLTEKLARQLATPDNNYETLPIVIYNHMSTLNPLEWPVNLEVENTYADLVLYVSESARDIYHEVGVKFPNEAIFANPAPARFWEGKKKRRPINAEKLNLLVVSNHPPIELLDALKVVEQKGHKVVYRGRFEQAESKRISPDDISLTDIVVTIGKTVQYSLASGVMVYCYDRFGGPGFLNKDNFDRARYNNFSGRGFEQKSSDQIIKELLGNIQTVAAQHVSLVDDSHKSSTYLPDAINQVVNQATASKVSRQRPSLALPQLDTLIHQLDYRNQIFTTYIKNKDQVDKLQEQYDAEHARNTELFDELNEVRANLKKRTTELNRIYASLGWKILKPLRLLKQGQMYIAKAVSPYARKVLYYSLRDDSLFTEPKTNLAILGHDRLTKKLTNINDNQINWGRYRAYERSPDRPDVSVVVLVLNHLEMTSRCIESILKAKGRTKFELLVVNNGSNITTFLGLRKLKKRYPQMRLIHNSQNLNFALGNNVGFAHARAETCVFINNDTFVTDYWLDRLAEPLRDDSIKLVQPALYYPDDTVQSLGIVFSKKSVFGYALYANMSRKNPVTTKSRKLQAVTAACVAIRSSDFAAVKGFDPSFVNGQEDVDLCLRVTQKYGGDCLCVADSIVYHDESKTPGRGKYVHDNRMVFKERWDGKIRADDELIYEEDGYYVQAWRGDSEEATKKDIEVFTPVLQKGRR